MGKANAVLIVELDGGGHRFYYVRLLAQAALAQGREVSLLVQGSDATSVRLESHLGGILSAINVVTVRDPRWIDVERVAYELDVQLVVVPDADHHMPEMLRRKGWRGPGRLNLLVMRAGWGTRGLPRRQRLRNFFKRVLVLTVAVQPRVSVMILRSPFWNGRELLGVVRDPISFNSTPDSQMALAKEWRLSPDRFWFAIVGAISPRKNVELVALALRRHASRRVGLVVAGQVDHASYAELERVLALLTNAGVPVVIRNELLSDRELDDAVGAVDCIVLAHSNEGPSGLLGKAMVAGTKVLAAGAESLREDCASIPEGTWWTPLDEAKLADGMQAVMRTNRAPQFSPSGNVEFTRRLLR